MPIPIQEGPPVKAARRIAQIAALALVIYAVGARLGSATPATDVEKYLAGLATWSADFTQTIDDGTLYFTVRFADKTSFCLRYACDMFAVGAELSDWQSGDFRIIREYMKPIPR